MLLLTTIMPFAPVAMQQHTCSTIDGDVVAPNAWIGAVFLITTTILVTALVVVPRRWPGMRLRIPVGA